MAEKDIVPRTGADVTSLTLEEIYENLRRIDMSDSKTAQQDDSSTSVREEDAVIKSYTGGDSLDGTDQLNERRKILRTRAMELSRHRIRPLSILELPVDVLREIFDYFGANKWRNVYRNMRRVCRLFNQVVSPLLFPCLNISLDQASLDRAEGICSNPLLSSGVKKVIVELDYRPRELAMDLARFVKFQERELEEMRRSCDYYHETWWLGGYDKNDETICPLPYREYDMAIDNIYVMRDAWAVYLPKQASDDSETEEEAEEETEEETDEHRLEYRKILIGAYDDYRQKHEEQFRLIVDGTFVKAIASLLSRLCRPISVVFMGEKEESSFIESFTDNPTLIPNNNAELSKFLTIPQAWVTIENIEGGAELEPAKILSDLPIACHRAGTPLHDIQIECFPIRNNYSMLQHTSWNDLRAACQKLERFQFSGRGMNTLPHRPDHIPPDDRSYIDGYLKAILSGHNLINVYICARVFGINDGRSDKKDHYRLGEVLSNCDGSQVRRLVITNSALTQTELETFCASLGNRLELVYFASVQLWEGNWADTLDILREKLAPRCKAGLCHLKITNLMGGEFGIKEPKKRNIGEWYSRTPEQWKNAMSVPEIIVQTQNYVSGGGIVENPLRQR